MASGGVYLLAWSFEGGYALALSLPWRAPVSLSNYCGVFVILLILTASISWLTPPPWFGIKDKEETKFATKLRLLLAVAIVVICGVNTYLFWYSALVWTVLATIFGLAGLGIIALAIHSRFSMEIRITLLSASVLLLCATASLTGIILAKSKTNWPVITSGEYHGHVILSERDGYLFVARLVPDQPLYHAAVIMKPHSEPLTIEIQKLGRIEPGTIK